MTPQRHAQIKQVFLEACARAPTERARFVAECCGADAELRAEVEALLAAHTGTATTHAATPAGGLGDSPRPDEATRTSGAPLGSDAGSAKLPFAVPAADSARDFQPGTLLAGRFRVVTLLGRGGMGDVYKADDLKLNQPVALKFLPVRFAADARWLGRLCDEVRLARTVTHPGVCRVYDINEVGGDHFITMEYVDGENLKALLARIGRLASDKAVNLSRQLCAALAAAHAKDVLHRDLKPANVMLDGQGRIRVMDFGLAALRDRVRPEEVRAGTPAYMAPEQITGAGVSVRSDLYSLGLVLYELFTGRPAIDPAAAPEDRTRFRPAAPSSLVADIDPATERAILRCLEPDPADRPSSVLELVAALPGGDALQLAQELGETPAPTLVAAAGQSGVSRRGATALLVAFVVLLATIVALGPRAHPLGQAGPTRSPAVLAEKAREHLAAAGIAPATAEAYGLTGGLLAEPGCGPAVAGVPIRADPSEVLFWYRSRSIALVPGDPERLVFGGARVTLDDPPLTSPGEVALVLDASGKLRAAQLVPEPDADRGAVPDWNVWHASAGLDSDALVAAEADTQLPILSDRRWAWRGPWPTARARTLRVEARAFGGQPVWYVVQRTEPDAAARAQLADVMRRRTLLTVANWAVLAGLLVIALPLTRANLARGRADFRGATRLAVFVFAVAASAALLQATHTSAWEPELRLLTLLATGALGKAVVVWLFYLALEPFARRYWPQLMVSWVRVLGGRLRDPLVGRDILLGAVLGAAGCLLVQLDGLVTTGLGLTPRPRLLAADFFAASLTLRESIAHAGDALRFGVYIALWFMFAAALGRHVLRRASLAAVVVVLLAALLLVPRASHPAVSFVLLAVGIGGGLVWVTMRYGLVPVAVGVTLITMLVRLPLTYDLRAWYAESAVFAALLSAAVALYGFVVARAAVRSDGQASR